jgi:acyl-coenzyme A thioesterase PaaI-like protein
MELDLSKIEGQTAFQDGLPGNHCWGCGDNPNGLQIKSYWLTEGEESICQWQAKSYHMAGADNIVHGGILASIMDCHTVCTAIAAAYHSEGRPIGSEPTIWYATGTMQLKYLAPVPIDKPVVLRTQVKETFPKKTALSCSLYSGEKECVQAEIIAVRMPSNWNAASKAAVA